MSLKELKLFIIFICNKSGQVGFPTWSCILYLEQMNNINPYGGNDIMADKTIRKSKTITDKNIIDKFIALTGGIGIQDSYSAKRETKRSPEPRRAGNSIRRNIHRSKKLS